MFEEALGEHMISFSTNHSGFNSRGIVAAVPHALPDWSMLPSSKHWHKVLAGMAAECIEDARTWTLGVDDVLVAFGTEERRVSIWKSFVCLLEQ